jgi:hypothetical protein
VWFYTVKVSETSGAPTTITAFSIDDYDLSDYIQGWFGSKALAANGSLSVDLLSRNLQVPSDHIFAFAGVDASGQKWAKQITVSFLGPKPGTDKGAAIKLTSDPATVVKIGKGDPDCSVDHPFGQKLTVQELNGVAVKLTKLVIGGYDYSDSIASWFKSQTLAASGTASAKLCWQLNSVPVTLSYELDGVDSTGKQVQATLNVEFKDPLGTKSGGMIGTSAQRGSTWPGRAKRDPRESLRTTSGMVVERRSAGGSVIAQQ